MLTITVYPTKASALNVKHPHGPQMTLDGVFWPKDSFTGRRLADGSATEDEAKVYVPPKPEEKHDDSLPEPTSDEKLQHAELTRDYSGLTHADTVNRPQLEEEELVAVHHDADDKPAI